MNNKLNELTLDTIQHDASVVFISETWWSDTSATNIIGFNLFTKNKDGRGVGGCIYIKNNIESFTIDDIQLNSQEIEQIWYIV